MLSQILLFYIACFIVSFFLCLPIGPVNLEVFHNIIKKHYSHAITIAFGAAFGDGIWAMCAFFGISPIFPNGKKNSIAEGIFLLITAGITFTLGILTHKDARLYERIEKKEEEIAEKIKKKRWSLLKGLIMVLINPLGIASWLIALSFLRKLKVYIPLTFTHEAIFFGTVFFGAFSYFSALIFITRRMKNVFQPERTGRIIKFLGYVLIGFSLYFLFFAIKAFLKT